MKKDMEKVIKAFRDEFMSRKPAVVPSGWEANVLCRLAVYHPNVGAVLSGNTPWLWPLAWSAAALALVVVSAVFFLDPAAASATAQIFSEINPAVQVVAAL